MKNEFKRIDQDITGMVADIPAKELKEIYYKRFYDALKTFYIEGDYSGFESKNNELNKLIERMTPEQKYDCLDENVNAFNTLCYDLRLWVRSESLHFMASTISQNRILQMIKEDLESYESTGDEYWYQEAKKTINHITDHFNELFWNDETMDRIDDYVMPLEDAPEISEEDKSNIDLLISFRKFYLAMQDLKHQEKTENE